MPKIPTIHPLLRNPSSEPGGSKAGYGRTGPHGRAQGGKARAAKLIAKERSAIAKKAARARWKEG